MWDNIEVPDEFGCGHSHTIMSYILIINNSSNVVDLSNSLDPSCYLQLRSQQLNTGTGL